MKFFTDKTVKNNYLLIKITDYLKLRNKHKDFSKWKEIFIDPNVYELKKNKEYSWLINYPNQIINFLNSLPYNHYFTLDYPSDMNLQYQELFLAKSWNNAIKFHNHSNYIVCIQSKFNDFWNFVEWFDKYNNISIKSNILGIGNLCQFRNLNEHLENVIDYAFSNCNHSRIHIYGLCLKAIPFTVKLANRYNIDLSIDSVKWTKACTVKLRNQLGINCNRKNRQIYFDTYLELINKRISPEKEN